MKSWNEIRKAATVFSKRWKGAYDEKSQAQSFLKEFFEVFGVDTVTQATFEHRVKFSDGSQGFVDCFWPSTILVEMKSKGKDLDAAFGQAMDYVRTMCDGGASVGTAPRAVRGGRGATALPRAIVVSDFQTFRFYDLTRDAQLTTFKLADLRKYVTLFGYMIGGESEEIREQDPVNRKAAEKMAKLHDALKAIGYAGRELEVYLVRLLFCLFAEDTQIFKPNQFSTFVREKTASDGSDLAAKIAELFQVLNTSADARLKTRDEEILKFPYVNGNLFGEFLPIPAFSAAMRTALLECGELDWSKISPAIFGAMFQGVMDETKRHDLGAHYTSEENILKVIRPLFLDRLREEFEVIAGVADRINRIDRIKAGSENPVNLVNPVKESLRPPRTLREKKIRLEQFHDRIAALKFLDPACGCGNFLLIAYRELRRLEMDVLEELHKDDPSMVLDVSTLCKVNVSQFYGIEIEQFPAEIAKVALWLMDHLCNLEVADRFGQYFARIPIKASPHIVCANALTTDWGELLRDSGGLGEAALPDDGRAVSMKPPHGFDIIMGNPPFSGRSKKSDEQQREVSMFFDYKDVDYVACWYAKANDLMQGTDTRCAFVSTNSITQGEQVAPIWRRMNAEIDFAYRTFKWHNEAKGVAAVQCVIIGFHAKTIPDAGRVGNVSGASSPGRENVSGASRPGGSSGMLKAIYDGDRVIPAKRINGYLLDGPDVLDFGLSRHPQPGVPKATIGNMPLDGGNLIIEAADYEDFLAREPKAKGVIKALTGSKEYINRLPRYCLWLKDVSPVLLDEMPLVMERVAKCREFRLSSKDRGTRKLAERPTLFRETNNPKSAIIIPKVSSERRDYVPMGFIDGNTIVTDLAFIVPDATLYHFGVLTSRMHMAWMRAFAGRMKSDYRYSRDLVYNTFIWPEHDGGVIDPALPSDGRAVSTKPPHGEIAAAAQAILDVRKRYLDGDPRCTLAILYDPLKMPPDLLKAHQHIDALVDKAYGRKFTSDAERVAHLFDLYAAAVKSF